MHLSPLNNIIDIFKSYKKIISPTTKIKPKQTKKSKLILTRYLTSLGVGNTQFTSRLSYNKREKTKKKGISKPFKKKKEKEEEERKT